MIEREIFHSGIVRPWLAYSLGAALALWVVLMLATELRRRHGRLRWAALATRLGLVGLLTLLLAQPNLLVTRRTPQQGHTLVLVDDSASMFVKDDWSTADAQLSLARSLRLPEIESRQTQWLDLVAKLKESERQLAPLFKAATEAAAAIRTGLPWSDHHQAAVRDSATLIATLKTTLETISGQAGIAPNTGRVASDLATSLSNSQGLASLASQTLDENQWLALTRQTEQVAAQLSKLEQLLADEQAAADKTFLAAAGRQGAITEKIKKLTRYDLAQSIAQAAPQLAESTPLNLIAGKQPVDALRAVGETQLVAPLVDVLTARPLDLINAVYLFSDGGQNGNFDLAELDLYRKRGVKLVVVGVGGAQADAPLTLVDYDCPPAIARGSALPVRVEFRVNLPAGTPVELTFSLEGAKAKKTPIDTPVSGGQAGRGAALPHQATVVSDGRPFLQHSVSLAANAPGAQTLRVEARVKEPNLEAVNRFPLFVRDAKPSVLLVAERPDKLTDSILSQQQYGIRVNPVFTYGKAKNAKRGASKQSIPKAGKDWGGHELVILKGKPFPGFTPQDATAIAAQMRAQGTTVLVVSDDGPGYVQALAQPLGWPKGEYGALAAANRISPLAEAAHLPPTILSGELIRNRNIWRQFAAPGVWQGVPAQTFSLIEHPDSRQSVLSLGLYNGGKLMCLGLGDLARMNQWQADEFDALVRAIVLDLVTPTGDWKTSQTAIGIYPPVAAPGQPSIILVHSKDAEAKTGEIRIEGGKRGSEPIKLAGQGGWLTTRHVFSEEGDYELHAGDATLKVRCQRQDSAETRDLSLREDFLKQMATAAGGTYVPLAQLDDALSATPDKTRESIDSRTIRTNDFTTLLLILFLGLACADFVVRKQLGMVL